MSYFSGTYNDYIEAMEGHYEAPHLAVAFNSGLADLQARFLHDFFRFLLLLLLRLSIMTFSPIY